MKRQIKPSDANIIQEESALLRAQGASSSAMSTSRGVRGPGLVGPGAPAPGFPVDGSGGNAVTAGAGGGAGGGGVAGGGGGGGGPPPAGWTNAGGPSVSSGTGQSPGSAASQRPVQRQDSLLKQHATCELDDAHLQRDRYWARGAKGWPFEQKKKCAKEPSGIEPETCRSAVDRSTAELYLQHTFGEWKQFSTHNYNEGSLPPPQNQRDRELAKTLVQHDDDLHGKQRDSPSGRKGRYDKWGAQSAGGGMCINAAKIWSKAGLDLPDHRSLSCAALSIYLQSAFAEFGINPAVRMLQKQFENGPPPTAQEQQTSLFAVLLGSSLFGCEPDPGQAARLPDRLSSGRSSAAARFSLCKPVQTTWPSILGGATRATVP
ncbi:hypothetical protein BDK51DRAFT_41788 [Blyttiomyces helicus]|uniref:Uncharacterized protein n=1 Tax=Blyttiomyces helicus TaxID=388810 RepID=A0A4P9VXB0_9FUNG|nr:hypothetical protein BDK51DRAFT_41788 [Blyttiomyces helicus]|eukprot:RKO84359.1 hypothetical protein BDK51DRAFT_41788 [Blyttiomyces helicus]